MTDSAQNAGSVDVHAQFVAWFTWGFILALAPCAIGIILVLISFISESLTALCGTLLNCSIGCAGLAWWITGIIWRFKASGSFASGDDLIGVEYRAEWDKDASLYQLRSG